MIGCVGLVPVVLLDDAVGAVVVLANTGSIAEISLFVSIGVGDQGCWVFPCNADNHVVVVVVAPAVAGLVADNPIIHIVKTVVLMLKILLL